MNTTTKALRRSLYAVFAASAVGGAAVAALMGACPVSNRRDGPLRGE